MIQKKKWSRIAGMMVFCGLVLGLTRAQAQVQLFNPACVVARIDGERVPFPLRTANTKFELAENETYLLNGTIVSIKGKTYFRVDFASQPWLETEKMLQFPFLPLNDSVYPVSQYGGRMVQIAVVAQKVEPSSISEGASGVNLNLILPPVPLVK